tara:strand:+ start:1198 stop:1623 length:426 start_codon:yes stop_codon:yes gene_type:complete
MSQTLELRIKEHEGFRNTIYLDSLGKKTVGWGHLCVEDHWEENVIYTKDILEKTFQEDLQIAKDGATSLLGGTAVLSTAKDIITEMVFQLGTTGVGRFKKMFKALEVGDYIEASKQMLDSKWNSQTPARCQELAKMMAACN